MVLDDEGLNRIRDLVYDDIYKVQAGTGTAVPIVSNTALGSAVFQSYNTANLVKADKQLTITNVILSTQGNGDTLAEANCELGSSATQYQLYRSTFNGLAKTSTEEHSHITRVFLRNNY